MPRALTLFTLISCFAQPVAAQQANYDEERIPEYSLPDPLQCSDGTRVTSPEEWFGKRRQELFELVRDHVYGRCPGRPSGLHFEVLEERQGVLGGKATRRRIAIRFTESKDGPAMELLLHVPSGTTEPVPAFLGLNFHGNHAVHADTDIPLTTNWVRNRKDVGIENNRASEASRGSTASRWALERIVERGYGVGTIYYGDIDPDVHDGFQNGVHALFRESGEGEERPPYAWGSISAWAWGLSRALDYLETDSSVDATRVAVLGHSRLGKTSLWAGARDPRFAIVISNNSGCGGAALSRRAFGETVARINRVFPHWFCDNFKRYSDNEAALPVDQHSLVALIAPRPVYVASAVEDRWADPNGEFLSLVGAEPVYKLLGTDGLGVSEQPALDTPVMRTMGYHVRSGGHDVKDYDWDRYMDFADKHFGRAR